MSVHRHEHEDEPESEISDSPESGQEDHNDERSFARTSEDLRRDDRETLMVEEEAERLLGHGDTSSGSRTLLRLPKGKNARRRNKGEYEGSRTMYRMEEGGRSSGSDLSVHSGTEKLHLDGGGSSEHRISKSKKYTIFTLVHLLIVLAFLGLLYGAWRTTQDMRTATQSAGLVKPMAKTLSNGTHIFAPTTILISLDGFRADFLNRDLAPTLDTFMRTGVSPKYMTPSFPSLTFPNHFTLVTGMYPESHGIVGNNFFDPELQKEFYYTDADRSMQPEWWTAEPLWETAERQGLRTAIHMWPGSEAHIGTKEPAYVDEFNMYEKLDRKVNRILGWLDLAGPDDKGASDENPRPQLIAAYVGNVDTDGHKYGPNSTHIRSTIREVDAMLGSLFRGIDNRNLTDIVNIIVVSDHGMATSSVDRVVQLDDILDTTSIQYCDGWPLNGIRLNDPSEANIQRTYELLRKASQLPQYRGAFDVYLRDKDMPSRYNFKNNQRIAPLWIVPRVGWIVVTKDEFDVVSSKAQGIGYKPQGLHGYDHDHPLMRAIFVARGPAFPHPSGSQVESFQNIEVYNIVCDSLGIEPSHNNGTLRLPLKPTGTHDFDHSLETPADPPLSSEVPNAPFKPILVGESDSPDATPTGDTPSEVPNLPFRPTLLPTPETPPQSGSSQTADSVASTEPAVQEDPLADEPDTTDNVEWWDWVKSKLEAIKGWAAGTFGGHGIKDELDASAG